MYVAVERSHRRLTMNANTLRRLTPPAAPMAGFEFVLEVAPSAAADVLEIQRISQLFLDWPTTETEIITVLERFEPLRFSFDFGSVQADYTSGMLALTPGYGYELNAEIEIGPIYSTERLWSFFSPVYTIEGWDRKARTFVRKSPLSEPSQEYEIEIRYKVTFSVTPTIVGWILDVRRLTIGIGGAFGYIVMGYALLHRMRVFFLHFQSRKRQEKED